MIDYKSTATYKYLLPGLLSRELSLRTALKNRNHFEVLGYYVGHGELDLDNVIYIRLDVISRVALNRLLEIPSVIRYYDLGDLFQTEVMLVVKLADDLEEARTHLLDSKYSRMYGIKDMRLMKKLGLLTFKTKRVLTKAATLRSEIEAEFGVSLPADVELDEVFHLEREIYEYGEEHTDNRLIVRRRQS